MFTGCLEGNIYHFRYLRQLLLSKPMMREVVGGLSLDWNIGYSSWPTGLHYLFPDGTLFSAAPLKMHSPRPNDGWTCQCAMYGTHPQWVAGWLTDWLPTGVKKEQSGRGNNSICSVSANNFIIALRNMSIKSSLHCTHSMQRIPNQQHHPSTTGGNSKCKVMLHGRLSVHPSIHPNTHQWNWSNLNYYQSNGAFKLDF